MIFDRRKFVKTGMLDAVGKMPDYWVVDNSLGWNEKGVLTEDDLAEIQAAVDSKNSIPEKLEPDVGVVKEDENSPETQEV